MGGQGSGGARKGAGRPEGSTAPLSKVVAVRLPEWVILTIEKGDGEYKIGEWIKWVCIEEADRLKKLLPGKKTSSKPIELKAKETKKSLPPKETPTPKPAPKPKRDDAADRARYYQADVYNMTDAQLAFEANRLTAQLPGLTEQGKKTAMSFLLMVERERANRGVAKPAPTPPKLRDVYTLFIKDKYGANFASEADAMTAAKALKVSKNLPIVSEVPRELIKPVLVKAQLEAPTYREAFESGAYAKWFLERFKHKSTVDQLSLPGVSGIKKSKSVAKKQK